MSFGVKGEIGSSSVGNVDAFVIGQFASGNHSGLGEIGAAGDDAQAQSAVIEQKIGIGGQRREDLRVQQGGALGAARRWIEVEAEGGAGFQADLAAFELPTRNFGPCRSARTPIGRPTFFSTARTMS